MKDSDVQQFGAAFAKIKARFDERNNDGLVCKQGFYDGCAVLKLQKARWTNDRMDQVQDKTGVFFHYGLTKGPRPSAGRTTTFMP